ncbi:acyltransferase [Methylobacterium sp. 77]|uniref:acyltransferase family protein n=1 Tax=Methylobacterium sp. 77 TaxID=1101192 RepID=UPI0009DC473D|nr:acyltransferase [Methylobacterium sp. 77]
MLSDTISNQKSLGIQDEQGQHFQTLDLLRGIAAIAVVIYHFSSRINYAGLMYHGYLAVDFFFCLSGYVIFRSYFHKFLSMKITTGQFIVRRLVRLMPLILLGNLIAAFTDLFRPGTYSILEHVINIVIVLIMSSFLLPTLYKTSLEETTYPLNGPVWSLFFEFFANIVFALIARLRFCKSIMMSVCVLSLILLIHASLITGSVHFGPHIEFFLLAFPRVFFSFFIGGLLNYINFKIKPTKWPVSAILIICIFIIPKIENTTLSATFDLVSIAFIFPLIVYLGANHANEANKELASVSGDLSYPLYCIHYPIVRGFSVIIRHFALSEAVNIIISILLTCIISALSLLIFYLYDLPIRKRLSEQLFSSRQLINR